MLALHIVIYNATSHLSGILECLADLALAPAEQQPAQRRNLRADRDARAQIEGNVHRGDLLHHRTGRELVRCAGRERRAEAADEAVGLGAADGGRHAGAVGETA
jgi:hypothetical protein